MGFFNVQQGDAPYLKELADTYTMSDNYHQAVKGGTGANHIMLGSGDAIWFSDGKGKPLTPPNNPVDATAAGHAVPGYANALNEIENPNPRPGHKQLLHAGWLWRRFGSPTAGSPNASYGGGSYTNCSDPKPARRRAVY